VTKTGARQRGTTDKRGLKWGNRTNDRPGGKPSWFEKAIVNQQIFNSLVVFAIIVGVITWWNQ
jgi:hypothetical protein